MTFADGEGALSAWLERNAWVAWVITDKPWELEEQLIRRLPLPLNLDRNRDHPFCPVLTEIRRAVRARARELPVLHHS